MITGVRVGGTTGAGDAAELMQSTWGQASEARSLTHPQAVASALTKLVPKQLLRLFVV